MTQGKGGGSKGVATRKARSRTADGFRYIEQVFYVLVATALAAAGAGLFVYVVYSFFTGLGDSSFLTITLELLDGLLLVFITTELLHTVRAVIDESTLLTEPFLIVGMVAVIRRLILISAEAKELVARRRSTTSCSRWGYSPEWSSHWASPSSCCDTPTAPSPAHSTPT